MRSTLILPIMGTMMYTISAAPVVSPRQDPTPTKPMMSIGWIPYPYQPGKSTPQPQKYGPRDVVLSRKDFPIHGDDLPVPCMGAPGVCVPEDEADEQAFVCKRGMDCYDIGPCNAPSPIMGHGPVCLPESMCCGHKFPWGKDHYDGPAFVCNPGMACFGRDPLPKGLIDVPAKREIDLGNAIDVDAIAGDVDAIIEDAGKVMTRNAPIVPDKLVSKIADAIDVDAEELEHDVQATAEEGTAFAHGAVDKLKHEVTKAMSAEPFVTVHGAPHAFGQDVEAKAEAAIGELEEEVASKGKAVEKAMANVAPGAVVGAENDIGAKAHASIKKIAPEMETMEAHGAAILKGAEAKLQAAGLEAF
ncbi:hypothetical protein LTR56_013002 [Elasticomyces elasticus]|nr:hypothetical protein LTR56_013002 [Elasticomyces elasticus]KAK4928180.1 hypothetical protein LTR49_005118 [Elasticomyces elasticus]KAK5765933.1 hypothetical protein LTS12_003940 [Elasticomyces elasticus]